MRSRRKGQPPTIAIATNNGDLGGGEVMLLNIAQALREIGIAALVIGPREPGELVAVARTRGFETVELPARCRVQYMAALAAWRLSHLRTPLWCNGLVPSLATAALGPRLVHLHILPHGLQRAALPLARLGARRVLTVSEFMASRLPGTTVLPNWTADITPRHHRERDPQAPWRIGFLGRLTRDKGVPDLARAITLLRSEGLEAELVLAGENRFGSADDDREITAALAPLGDAVRHLGWVRREEFFDAVDLAVFPSRWEEPFGLVAAEAMAARVPFVITDSGAFPEVVGSDHPWIARRADPVDLAHTIRRALEAPAGERTELLERSRWRWEHTYSPRSGTARVAHLIGDLR
ncbi:glycosyltransferase family 4 protein [Brachybacterium sp. Marseille-Q7125]|uniref:glycosyltransferase family 4 protein n=1 Tax=Brachybacterium sp. Marseille-Q7125 TaxID=2932815 RepID=UPI001FF5AA2E|nr:glycosyltransferase family 4 protein [Brachybacterium sp. Marseille-Q7125]